MKSIVFIVCLLALSFSVSAQIWDKSPLYKTITVSKPDWDSSSKVALKFLLSQNPDSVQKVLLSPIPALEKGIEEIRPSYHNTYSFFGWIFFLGILLLAVWQLIFPGYLLMSWEWVIFPEKFIELEEYNRFGFGVMHWLPDIMLLYSSAITIHIGVKDAFDIGFGWMLLLVLVVFFLKILFIQLFGSIFFERKIVDKHLQSWLGAVRPLGVLLFLSTHIILYSDLKSFDSILVILLGTVYLLSILVVLRAMMKATDKGGLSKVYLFVYLCTTEITPIMIVLRDVFI